MRIILLTQNETMFLPSAIEYFIRRKPEYVTIVGSLILSPSPFGEAKSFIGKFINTINIFGFKFTLIYGINYLYKKIFKLDVFSIMKKFNIPIIKVNNSINSQEYLKKISELKPDLIISITGNQIFKKPLLNIPQNGILNLHTSLLPKYRGLMPTFWALKNKEKETGVSVFFVDEGIDSGPILVQKKIKLGNITQWNLIKITKFLGIEAIIEGINIIKSSNIKTIENNNKLSSYFSFPSRKDVMDFKMKGGKFF